MKIINLKDRDIIPECIEECIEVLNNGGLIVYPTDTLYAIGANPYDDKAVEKVFKVKERPSDLPISIAVSSMRMLNELVVLDPLTVKICNEFLPGPLTLLLNAKVLKKNGSMLENIAVNTDKIGLIGLRIPKHEVALELIERFGGPLTTTSANLHQDKEPYEVADAVKQLGDSIDLYLDCGSCPRGAPSTIIEVDEAKGEVLVVREGAITCKEIEDRIKSGIEDKINLIKNH